MAYFLSSVIYPKVESRRSSNWAPVFQGKVISRKCASIANQNFQECNDAI